jgi:hypothetical protein
MLSEEIYRPKLSVSFLFGSRTIINLIIFSKRRESTQAFMAACQRKMQQYTSLLTFKTQEET